MSFRDYAADSWHRHLKSGVPGDADLISLAVKFFSDSNPNWNAWREWFDLNDKEGTDSMAEAIPPNPLYYASELNLVDIATCLIRQNPSLAAQQSSLGRTALATACSKGHTAVVGLLLDAGADETNRDTVGRTPLYSASKGGHVEVVELLLDKGADVGASTKDGRTPLYSASKGGHVEVVELLLDKGADVGAATKDGRTPLYPASGNGHFEVVKALLNKGADVAAASKNGWTPIHSASENGHVEVVQELLDKRCGCCSCKQERMDANQNLSLETQLRSARNARRSQESYLRLGLLKQESQELRSSLEDTFAKLNRRTLSADIMDYLEFAEDPELYAFSAAFQLPVLEDGFELAGQASDKMGSDYLIKRWIANKGPGALQHHVTTSGQRIWAMPPRERDTRLQEWESAVRQDQITVVTDLMTRLDKAQRDIDAIFSESRHNLIKSKRVVGCTTTAVAKYSSLLAAYQPGCVLVEEAGEIMEAHILTALSSTTQQLVLIGDHKQLRPKCNNYALSVEKGDGFDLNRSLFERLILHGTPIVTLRKQHRMDPQISQIVRSMTYPDLLDDEKTLGRSATRGIRSRVSFINHSQPEGVVREIGDRRDEASTCSKENQFEARMILKLIRYLAQQGYNTGQVVVLTPYLGQLRLLRNLLSKENDPLLSDMDSAELLRAGEVMSGPRSSGKKDKQAKNVDETKDWDQTTVEYEWMCMKRDGLSNSAEIDALMRMVGLQTVKRSFLDMKTMVDTAVRQEVSLKDERFGCSLLGNPGTAYTQGKTTVARLYGRFLTSMGVIAGGVFKETTGSKLANMGVTGCQSLIDEVLDDGGGVIFIDEAYQLSSGHSPGGRAVLDFLLAEVENLRSSLCFILAGYAKQMESFFAHNPGFPSRFPLEMKFEDYNDEELLRILELQVDTKYGGRMRAEDGLKGLYCRIVSRRIGRRRGKEGFGNARAVENELSKIYRRQSKRLEQERRRSKQAPDDLLLSSEDLIGPTPSNSLCNSRSWTQLQELIGLASVKESVKSLVDTIEVNYQRELDEKPIIEYNLNRVFLGNPGTGKTTVAKIYGQILVDLGMLSNGEVVVKNPSDLVGGALGQSEQQTKGVLANTVGKVLVIDEAYGLYGGEGSQGGSGSDPYKTAVVDTIVATVHSTPGDDRCVLLLGYRDQMEQMFQNVNPGLSRRFPLSSAFEFADFNQQELARIVDLKVKQQAFDLTALAKKVAMGVLDRARNRPNFGNAGEVDILLNEAKARHQKRWAAGETKRVSALEALDFDPDYARTERSDTNVVELFKGTVGCERIIATLQGYQETVRKMSVLGLDPKESIPFNFLFRGPPGTGKTTTARRMGKVFYDAGFLASADVLDCSASDIIGQYVGQTGPKVRQMLDKALGKVLLIDEAYRLAEGHYAKEALDEIVDACTKEKYRKRLIIVLAGYEDDINRLLDTNPGMSSRFPEVLNFYGLSPKDCLSLLTKKFQKQKASLEQPGKGTMDLGCLTDLSEDFRATIEDKFGTLSSQPNWASARDVESLYAAIFKSALQSSPGGTEIVLSEAIVLHELEVMIAERENRGKQSGLKVRTAIGSFPLQQSIPDLPLTQPRVTKPASSQVTQQNEADTAEDITTPVTDHSLPIRRSKTAIRDAGVSDLVWNQLQADKRLEQQREQEHQAKLKAKNEAIDEKLREKIVNGLLEEEARRKEEAEVKKRLEMAGRCPMGYAWIRQEGGWRCEGGSHFVGENELEMYSA